MKTKLTLNENLIAQGLAMTGLKQPQKLIDLALRELIARRTSASGAGDAKGTLSGRQPGSARGKLRILSEDDEHLAEFGDCMQ